MASNKTNKQIGELQNQITDLENKWKRALADYRNLEKRIQDEHINRVRCSNAELIDKLLPVLDNLERAEKHLKEKGVKLILNQFRNIFNSEGVEEVKVLGEEFNPVTMDCVEMNAGQKNKVVEVVQKGYLYHGEVLRPAKVKVGKGKIKLS